MIYHGVFTSFQCHGPVSVEALNKAKEVIFDIQLSKVTRPNNNHVVKENQMVASWTKSKPILQNALSKLQDDNVGEDSLSSQLIFDQDINSDGYLNSLVPLERLLTIESHANLQEIYTVLCKSVHDIRVKLATNDTIFGIDENQSISDTTIAENRATSAVTNIDDIEFWDWAGRTRSHSLWYCNIISKSPVLKIAVAKGLRKSCHDNMVSAEFFEGITISKIQFMGFVSQHTKQGYLSCFHPVSFVLFRTDVYSSSTVIICTLTTRNHIQSNMQDRLLQLVQIYQYQAQKIKFLTIISNELVGVDITLNYSFCFGHNAMGFDTPTVTLDHDYMDGYFGITTHCPIPVLQYGDSFTWAKYCYMVLHPDMIRKLKSGQDTSYCNALRSFL